MSPRSETDTHATPRPRAERMRVLREFVTHPGTWMLPMLVVLVLALTVPAVYLGGTIDPRDRDLGIATRTLDQPRGHAFLVLQQGLEDMLGGDALVVQADRNGLRRLEKALGAVGEFFEVHGCISLLLHHR